MKMILSAAAAALVFLGSPAVAKDEPSAPNADASKKICENITVLGSRLAVKRVCATRAQWEAKRREDRAWIDKGQREVCVVQKSGGGGPSC